MSVSLLSYALSLAVGLVLGLILLALGLGLRLVGELIEEANVTKIMEESLNVRLVLLSLGPFLGQGLV